VHSKKETLEEGQVEERLMHNKIPTLNINEQHASPVKKKICNIKEPEFPVYDDQAVVENRKGLMSSYVGEKKKKGTYLDKHPTLNFTVTQTRQKVEL